MYIIIIIFVNISNVCLSTSLSISSLVFNSLPFVMNQIIVKRPVPQIDLKSICISNSLTLLDLSESFDTIDHNKLLQYHSDHLTFGGNSLKFMRSYLSDRFLLNLDLE